MKRVLPTYSVVAKDFKRDPAGSCMYRVITALSGMLPNAHGINVSPIWRIDWVGMKTLRN